MLKWLVVIASMAMLFPALTASAPLQQDLIRIAVTKGVDTVRLDGEGLLATDERGEPLRIDFPAVVKSGRDAVQVQGRSVRRLTVAAASSVAVNGKKYRGVVEVYPAERGLLVVNQLPLEDYLVGLINCEISSQWPIEAVKAQAVIARTYALYQRENRKTALYHLESSVLDQVYEGCAIEDSRAARGVHDTAGEVLTFKGRIIQAFYHSNCGGHTESAENVWGAPLEYLAGVDCKYCLSAPSVKWEQTLQYRKIESLLKAGGYQVTGLRELRPGVRNRNGRLKEIVMVTGQGNLAMNAVSFRKVMGYGVIKSTNFEMVNGEGGVQFIGVGYGHGVGLCQWGAKQRAGDGFDYHEILSYYYPGTRVEKTPHE
jgi:stage II sporulation protein D